MTIETVADLLESLGDIPPERIRMRPPPGAATEDDVLAVHASEKRLCELVDGVLVEKPMGYDESRLAAELIYAWSIPSPPNLGTAAGADGMMRLLSGLVRIPDVSFVRWEHLPESYGPFRRLRPIWPSRSSASRIRPRKWSATPRVLRGRNPARVVR